MIASGRTDGAGRSSLVDDGASSEDVAETGGGVDEKAPATRMLPLEGAMLPRLDTSL